MPYSEVSIVGYNANPPSDDGTQATQNEVAWDKHKGKLTDPLRTAIENTQTNITTVVNSIEADLIEAGTAMLFMQSAAPTGWTKDTTANLNDTALRLVTGTVSSRTANVAFSTCFGRTATDAHTLTTGEIPSHTHTVTVSGSTSLAGDHSHTYQRRSGVAGVSGGGSDRNQGATNATSSVAGAHTHTVSASGTTSTTGSGGSHTHDMDIRVNYHDVIRATKD